MIRHGTPVGVRDDKFDCVFGLIVLWSSSHGEFRWKIIDEAMGPVEIQCPVSILNLLTPLPVSLVGPSGDLWSEKWRAACRANAKRRTIKLSHGQVIKFDNAMSFGGYGTEDTFTVIRMGRRTLFRTPTGVPCRITKWQTRSFTVVEQP